MKADTVRGVCKQIPDKSSLVLVGTLEAISDGFCSGIIQWFKGSAGILLFLTGLYESVPAIIWAHQSAHCQW